MKRLVFVGFALTACRSEVDPRAWAKVCEGQPLASAKAYDPNRAADTYPIAAARREGPQRPWTWSPEFVPSALAKAGVAAAGKSNGADVELVVCVDHVSETLARECRMAGDTQLRQLDETVAVSVREAKTARILGTRTLELKAPPTCPRYAVMLPGQKTSEERPSLAVNADTLSQVVAGYLPAPVQRKL